MVLRIGLLFALLGPGFRGEAAESPLPEPADETLGLGQRELPLEEIEDLDGKTFRGRVVGFDTEKNAYILRTGTGELRVPEDRIRTIRQLDDVRVESGEAPLTSGSRGSSLDLLQKQQRHDPSRFLRELLRERESLPVPRSTTARRAYEKGVEFALDGSTTRARSQLDRVLGIQPDFLSARLFLGALYLGERKPAEAYRHLHRAHVEHPESLVALELLVPAARQLGYTRLAGELAEKHISLRYHGAERLYRIFLLRREEAPGSEETLRAWKDYLALDPDLDQVESLEARWIAQGKKALLDREPHRALEHLAAAARVNPYLAGHLRPLRIRALEIRSLLYRDRGEYELFLSDLRALEREDPSKAEEYRGRRDEGEAELVRVRLEAASGVSQADRVLRDLEVWIPDLLGKHRSLILTRYDRLARRAIFHNEVEAGSRALVRCRELGAEVKGLLDYLERQVELASRNGRQDLARRWVDVMSELDPARARALDVQPATGVANPLPAPEPASRSQDGPPLPGTEARPREEIIVGVPVPEPTVRESIEKIVTPAPSPSPAPALSQPPEEVISEPEADIVIGTPLGPPAESDLDSGEIASGPEAIPTAPSGEDGDLARLREYVPLIPGERRVYRHRDGTIDYQFLDRVEMHPQFGSVYRHENHFEIGELRIPYTKSSFWLDGKLHQGAGVDPSTSMQALAVPLVEGGSWEWKNGEITFERRYESLDETVTCGAGTFENCLKVKAVSRYRAESTRAVVQWFTYAPGVGLVKVESENPAEGYELESYSRPEPASPEAGTPAVEGPTPLPSTPEPLSPLSPAPESSTPVESLDSAR